MNDFAKHMKLVTTPLYSYAEADYLANVSRGTSKRWLSGYQYVRPGGARVRQPPVTPRPGAEAGVSFMDLVEIVAIGGLKHFGFSLKEVRRIVNNCQRFLDIERPLTALQFKVGGHEIFVDRGEELLEVGRKRGLRAWRQVLEPFLDNLDYSHEVSHEVARRWWPLGRANLIVIDPDYGFGLPVIVNSGVRTEIILERFRAGDLERQIASDFSVGEIEVERALQFELSRAA